jgi:hypothetical protein
LDLAGVLELVDHHVLERDLVPETVVLAEQDVREQLEEAEVQIVTLQGELEVLV